MKQVIIVEYDRAWPAAFEEFRRRLWPAIADAAESIEHVGSTAVPGLAAKPIIDMTIVVPAPAAMTTVIDRLAGLGYRHQGDRGMAGREAFDNPPGAPAHHLYAAVRGNLGLRNHQAIRDHLRRHPAAARAYGELKKELAARFPNDINAYIEGKTRFLSKILAQEGLTQAEP
ncbi:MAG TPA: GrpB family protein, partial [Tepidisphaeraceae bacterium]|nr:GrpB family protein [Tepidisphaeraceae bacterium]